MRSFDDQLADAVEREARRLRVSRSDIVRMKLILRA
jgi:hypothetical protein